MNERDGIERRAQDEPSNTENVFRRSSEREGERGSSDGVRIAELGRPPHIVHLGPDEHMTIADLIAEGHVTGAPDVQYFVNSRQVHDLSTRVENGDSVVAVKRITAGC